jgi:putative methionine-R-sulfoxide reductase with GAF domain
MASISGNQLRDWEYFKNVQFPVLLVNSNGSVCNYNAPAKHIFKFKDSLNGKNIYDLISIYTSKKFTEEDVKIGNENAQILNISTSENGNFEDQVSIYVFPNTIMENGEEGYIFILIKPFKDKERVAEIRHFHYLKTINKISSKSYRYNDMEILSQFVVSELYNEEYNFFHVGIFLRENNFKGEYVYLSALAGESKKLFYENSEDIYRQSIQQGVIGETIRKGRPIIVDNTESVVYYHSTPFFKGKSELCVPIYLIDQVIGAINIESNTFVHFDEVVSS